MAFTYWTGQITGDNVIEEFKVFMGKKLKNLETEGKILERKGDEKAVLDYIKRATFFEDTTQAFRWFLKKNNIAVEDIKGDYTQFIPEVEPVQPGDYRNWPAWKAIPKWFVDLNGWVVPEWLVQEGWFTADSVNFYDRFLEHAPFDPYSDHPLKVELDKDRVYDLLQHKIIT